MKKARFIFAMVIFGALATGMPVQFAGQAFAHCDSTSGPVIPQAQAALESGDVTPILKWVAKENEAEIKKAFARTIAVRTQSAEARDLADRYFLETLVRLHRAGEGAPYTGIDDRPVEPIVAMADQSLAGGSAEEMIKALSSRLAKSIRERFKRAVEAKARSDRSVEAGREFVDAYVTYVHYVEGIHSAILSAAPHHSEQGNDSAGHEK